MLYAVIYAGTKQCYMPSYMQLPSDAICHHTCSYQSYAIFHHIRSYKAMLYAIICAATKQCYLPSYRAYACLVMKSKKKNFFLIKTGLKKNIVKKTCFFWFFIIYNLKAGKCFLILWSAYSCLYTL